MSSELQCQEKLSQTVKSLRDKANMLATCHSVLSDRYGKANSVLLSLVLCFSTFSVGVAFISDQFVKDTIGVAPETLKWIQGLAAILTFAAGLLLTQWDLASKSAKHYEALRHYFSIVNRARQLLDQRDHIIEQDAQELRARYEDTEPFPKIPDSRFIKLKQHHLRKISISRELEDTPHASLHEIRKRLRRREKQNQAPEIAANSGVP